MAAPDNPDQRVILLGQPEYRYTAKMLTYFKQLRNAATLRMWEIASKLPPDKACRFTMVAKYDRPCPTDDMPMVELIADNKKGVSRTMLYCLHCGYQERPPDDQGIFEGFQGLAAGGAIPV